MHSVAEEDRHYFAVSRDYEDEGHFSKMPDKRLQDVDMQPKTKQAYVLLVLWILNIREPKVAGGVYRLLPLDQRCQSVNDY